MADRTPSAALRAFSACSASNWARFLAMAFGMAPGSLAFAAAAAIAASLSSHGALRPVGRKLGAGLVGNKAT